MNAKQLINEAIEYRKSREISFRKRCGEGVLSDIARESGVSYPSLTNWKKGKTEPKHGDLVAVLNACGCDFKLVKN